MLSLGSCSIQWCFWGIPSFILFETIELKALHLLMESLWVILWIFFNLGFIFNVVGGDGGGCGGYFFGGGGGGEVPCMCYVVGSRRIVSRAPLVDTMKV